VITAEASPDGCIIAYDAAPQIPKRQIFCQLPEILTVSKARFSFVKPPPNNPLDT
jgi:hypothetical protein